MSYEDIVHTKRCKIHNIIYHTSLINTLRAVVVDFDLDGIDERTVAAFVLALLNDRGAKADTDAPTVDKAKMTGRFILKE